MEYSRAGVRKFPHNVGFSLLNGKPCAFSKITAVVGPTVP